MALFLQPTKVPCAHCGLILCRADVPSGTRAKLHSATDNVPSRCRFCQAEEFRADLQAGALRRERIDFEMDFVSVDRQVDDPAQHCEPLGFADRQSA